MAPAMGELQAPAGLLGDLNCLLQWKQVVGRVSNKTLDVTAAHELRDHEGLFSFLT